MSLRVGQFQSSPLEVHWNIIQNLSFFDAANYAKTCKVARHAFYSYFNLPEGSEQPLAQLNQLFTPSVRSFLIKKAQVEELEEKDFHELPCSVIKTIHTHAEWISQLCQSMRLYKAKKLAKKCIEERNEVVFYQLFQFHHFTPSQLVIFLDEIYAQLTVESPEMASRFINSEVFSSISIQEGSIHERGNCLGKFLYKIAPLRSRKTTLMFRLILSYPPILALSASYLTRISHRCALEGNIDALGLLHGRFPDFYTVDYWISLCEFIRLNDGGVYFYNTMEFAQTKMTWQEKREFNEKMSLDMRWRLFTYEM